MRTYVRTCLRTCVRACVRAFVRITANDSLYFAPKCMHACMHMHLSILKQRVPHFFCLRTPHLFARSPVRSRVLSPVHSPVHSPVRPYVRSHVPPLARAFARSPVRSPSPLPFRGGDLKNVRYILNMVKMQVLEILQLHPPPRVQVRYRSQRPKNVTYILGLNSQQDKSTYLKETCYIFNMSKM